MAVPKRRKSKMRRDQRRSHHKGVKLQSLSRCPKCQEPKLPHYVCPSCGHYKGREVIAVEEV